MTADLVAQCALLCPLKLKMKYRLLNNGLFLLFIINGSSESQVLSSTEECVDPATAVSHAGCPRGEKLKTYCKQQFL